jgi:uncharacterized protein (DUF2141 family)
MNCGKGETFKEKKMKSIFVLLLISLPLVSYAQGRIEVVVTNIKPQTGTIRIGLFNSENDFPDKAIAGKIVKVTGAQAVVSFEGLENGEYAVSIFHDENSNEQLDTNLIGVPKEGFGFGNNAMGTFGPPSFEKAKVRVEGSTVIQEIALKYF